MSFTLSGIGVSRGVAIGTVHILAHNRLEITEFSIAPDKLEAEINRFQEALDIATRQFQRIRDQLPGNDSAEIASFIDPYLLMLQDSSLSREPIELMKVHQCNAEWALEQQRNKLVSIFEEMEDSYLRSRKDDVENVINRLQTILLSRAGYYVHEEVSAPAADSIVLADDLSPTDTVLMQHQGIAAFVTEHGGITSHTAILARSLGIPALVGVRRARRYIRHDDNLVVDGSNGVLLVNPDKPLRDYYFKRLDEEKRRYRDALHTLAPAPTQTMDKVPISLQVNIEPSTDIKTLHNMRVEGVGLYRTEFLYLGRTAHEPPDEEEHYQAYAQLVISMKNKPVTVRTLDLGGDKQFDRSSSHSERTDTNPALGLRAVRMCLKETNLFKPQLKALLRAAALGPLQAMIPMLSSLQELAQVRQLINESCRELKVQGYKYNPKMPLGCMVEIPALAICADLFAPHVDFFSIGTNDLIQYILAVDRVDDEVNYLYDPHHPAVLRLLKSVIDAANKAGKPLSMCGEMAADSRYVRLLLGLGLRSFSVNPESYLEVKEIINSSYLSGLSQIAGKTLETASGAEISKLLEAMNA